MRAELPRPKAFKLRALHGPQRFGVAGRSPEEVLRKGCRLLQVPERGARLCVYEDGAPLGDAFGRAAEHTELLLLAAGERWPGYAGDVARLLSVLRRPQARLVLAARRLLEGERAPLRCRLLSDLLGALSGDVAAETRAQDPPWFEGLEPRFRSKSAYLRHSCESRMRGYLREVSAYTAVVDAGAREEYARLVDAMGEKLRAERYQGSYFDRGAEAGGRLCTPEGWFSCQGPFDMAACASRHSINPYSNRESRIIFSTWNLDHVIEKKRTVVPALAEAVAARDGREVDWEYFYRLLFTSENLKLVHIACHKKTVHQLHCDPRSVYKAQSKPRRKKPPARGHR